MTAPPDNHPAIAVEAARTSIPPPRHRVFLPASRRERTKAFWWSMVRRSLFRWSPPRAYRWRVRLLRLFGADVDRSARIEPSVLVDHPWSLTVGPDAVVAHRVILNCMGRVAIGAGTRISQYTHIVAGTHEYTRPDMVILRQPVTIGRECWIAADAFIGPGVTIGDRAIVAARSSVFHDLPPGMICAGEPATIRKPRPPLDRPTGAPPELAGD